MGVSLGSHPVNLAFRFLLELAALGAMGVWGWHHGAGPFRALLALALPLAGAALWGVFAVRGDPSRSGSAPIPVPGFLRLGLEAAFFGFAAWALHATGHRTSAALFGVGVILHYAVSYDRVAWLLRTQP
jgi:hypothetical protein